MSDPSQAIVAAVKRQFGPDMTRRWIVFNEIDRFVWPGYDLRSVPRTGGDSHGMLPEACLTMS